MKQEVVRERGETVRRLDIETWHALAAAGTRLPMHLRVSGSSMWPLIRSDRDTLTIVPLESPPQVGDIVLFRVGRESPRYVLHRVVAQRDGLIQTRGDGCLRADAWISAADVLGIAVRLRRGAWQIDPTRNVWQRAAACWNAAGPIREKILRLRARGQRVYQKWFGRR